MVSQALLWAWLLPAMVSTGLAAYDLHTRRIPNLATYSLLLVGLVLRCVLGTVEEALVAVSLCLLPGIGAFYLGIMGGGDVKLLAALGAWLIPQQALWLLLLSIVFAAGIALVVLAIHLLRSTISDAKGREWPTVLAFGGPICCDFWFVNMGGGEWLY